MRMNRSTIDIRTQGGQQFLDVTALIREALLRWGVRNGMLLVNSLQTTVALFINEFQSALPGDMASTRQKLIPRRNGYLHDDPRHSDCERANAHAHLRATLLGRSIVPGVGDGEILLGAYRASS
jgi:secondary thiamine-phosphate synthase enzyme